MMGNELHDQKDLISVTFCGNNDDHGQLRIFGGIISFRDCNSNHESSDPGIRSWRKNHRQKVEGLPDRSDIGGQPWIKLRSVLVEFSLNAPRNDDNFGAHPGVTDAKITETVRETSVGPNICAKSAFFELLGQLEREEIALKGELQSYKDLQRDLTFKRIKSQQRNQSIQSDVTKARSGLEIQENQIHNSEYHLKELQAQLKERKTELQALYQLCNELKSEGELLSSQLKQHGTTELLDLQTAERAKSELLIQKRNELEHKQKALERIRKFYEKASAEVAAKQAQQQSVSHWFDACAMFTSKLRRAKEDLNTIESDIASSEKTEARLVQKFRDLIGE